MPRENRNPNKGDRTSAHCFENGKKGLPMLAARFLMTVQALILASSAEVLIESCFAPSTPLILKVY
jgi:hypothetical protein